MLFFLQIVDMVTRKQVASELRVQHTVNKPETSAVRHVMALLYHPVQRQHLRFPRQQSPHRLMHFLVTVCNYDYCCGSIFRFFCVIHLNS